jgi:hypothetical protein
VVKGEGRVMCMNHNAKEIWKEQLRFEQELLDGRLILDGGQKGSMDEALV